MKLKTGAPRQIGSENFGCISEHYENLTCVWSPPDYNVDTQYKLFEVLPSGHVSDCPRKINETSCQWTMLTTPHYRSFAKRLTLGLNSSNVFGNWTETFQVNNFAIILPSKPEDVEFVDVTPTRVWLKWKVPKNLDFGPVPDDDDSSPHVVYEISVFRAAGLSLFRTIPVGYSLSVNITDLIPFTPYRFSVRCKSDQASGDHMWSEYVNVTISTKRDGELFF